MSVHPAHLPCFLVEWYSSRLDSDDLERAIAKLDDSAALASSEIAATRLVTMVAVPDDGVVFGVFAAASADLVAQTCQRAGLPPQRLTPALDTRIEDRRTGVDARRDTVSQR